jgi:triosephosphate isomerase
MGNQTVRRPVIAGNWKMHMTCAQAREFMAAFLPLVADMPNDRDLVLGSSVHSPLIHG